MAKKTFVPGCGDLCPRCKKPTEIHEHPFLTDKHLRQPFYYSRWFICRNRKCRTNMIMPEKHKVYTRDLEIWGETEAKSVL